MVWLSDSTSIQADCSGGRERPRGPSVALLTQAQLFPAPPLWLSASGGETTPLYRPSHTEEGWRMTPLFTYAFTEQTQTRVLILSTHIHMREYTHTQTHTVVCVRPCWITGQHCFLISINLFSLTQKWPTNLWKAVSALRLSIKTSALCTTQYHTVPHSITEYHTVSHSITDYHSTYQNTKWPERGRNRTHGIVIIRWFYSFRWNDVIHSDSFWYSD